MLLQKVKVSANIISAEHADHLDNILNGGLMRKVTPEHIAEHFIQNGYIRRAVGGYVATEGGHNALMMYNKTK